MKVFVAAMVVLGMCLFLVGCGSKESKELKLDLGDNVALKLVRIPAGKFLMGSPETEKNHQIDEVQHEVTISKPFFMGVTHVTVDQFAAFAKDSGYKTDAEKERQFAWHGNQGRRKQR